MKSRFGPGLALSLALVAVLASTCMGIFIAGGWSAVDVSENNNKELLLIKIKRESARVCVFRSTTDFCVRVFCFCFFLALI